MSLVLSTGIRAAEGQDYASGKAKVREGIFRKSWALDCSSTGNLGWNLSHEIRVRMFAV